jgi:putative hemolysin
MTNLYVVKDLLMIDLPTEEFDTLSGFVIGQLGYIPNGEEKPVVEFENMLFAVEEMDDKRIMQIRVTVLEKEEVEVIE